MTDAERILYAAAASNCPPEALAMAREWVARQCGTTALPQTPERPLRGKAYYDHLKVLLGIVGSSLAAEARLTEALTPVTVGILALRYGLNYKACCEWLEECRILPAGTYDRIADGLKIKDILTEAHNRLAEKVQP
jgi:hypothetical protein